MGMSKVNNFAYEIDALTVNTAETTKLQEHASEYGYSNEIQNNPVVVFPGTKRSLIFFDDITHVSEFQIHKPTVNVNSHDDNDDPDDRGFELTKCTKIEMLKLNDTLLLDVDYSLFIQEYTAYLNWSEEESEKSKSSKSGQSCCA